MMTPNWWVVLGLVLVGVVITALVMYARLQGLRAQVLEVRGEAARLRQSLLGAQEAEGKARAKLEAEQAAASQRQQEAARSVGALEAQLNAERQGTAEKLALLQEAERGLKATIEAACARALANNSQAFLGLAGSDFEARRKALDELVRPIQDSIVGVNQRLQAFDVARAESQASLSAELRQVVQGQRELSDGTAALVTALRTPQGRGQWGEMQLRRVVEMAGMLEHCDFALQQTVPGEDGRLRPDMLVRLPGNKVVVVDAKTPLTAYLNAMEATDEQERASQLAQHARQVCAHVDQLAERDYPGALSEASDFAVLFLPGESFFSAACQADPGLLEYAVRRGVILASPTTLLTVLRAAAYAWQQESIGRNAMAIRDLGETVYERLATFIEHLQKIQRGLESAVSAFNGAVGSFEARLLPSARKFNDLQIGTGAPLEDIEPVDVIPRLPDTGGV